MRGCLSYDSGVRDPFYVRDLHHEVHAGTLSMVYVLGCWSYFFCLYYRLPNQKYIANSCLQNNVDSFDLSFFLPSSYTLFWPSIIWFIYNHHQTLPRNKLCSLSLSLLYVISYQATLFSVLLTLCNPKTTPIQNAIYTSTIDQAILLSILSLFYTQDQAILLINVVTYLYKFKPNLITYINTNKQ